MAQSLPTNPSSFGKSDVLHVGIDYRVKNIRRLRRAATLLVVEAACIPHVLGNLLRVLGREAEDCIL